MNAITTLSNLLTTGTVQDHELITLTTKQSKQIQLVRECANTGELLDLITTKDKALANIVLSQLASTKLRELLITYVTTGNPTSLVRWCNLQIGTLNIPLMPFKKAELANYEANLSSWVSLNSKGEPNTEKSANARRAAIRWMLPILETIRQMNTVTEPTESQTESLQG